MKIKERETACDWRILQQGIPRFRGNVPFAKRANTIKYISHSAARAMASVVLKEDKTPVPPVVNNSYRYPELTTFGPEITQKVPNLDCLISVVAVSLMHVHMQAAPRTR